MSTNDKTDKMHDSSSDGPVSSRVAFQCNNKFLFCLCRTCATAQNVRGPCHHLSDAERAISGTWVLDEVRMAVSKGYRNLEIHEVYEYWVTKYGAATGEGGLFVE